MTDGATKSAGGPSPQASAGGALGRCISISQNEFAGDYWARRPLLSLAADLAGDFSDLLTAEDIDELLSMRGLRTPFLRVAKDGSVIHQSRFTGSGGAGASIVDQVIDEKILDLFADGSTVILQGLHRTWPPIQEFATALSIDLGHPVQVNAYITPPHSRGFSAHFDVHDVFVLQVLGAKRWTIHEPVRRWPLSDEPWGNFRETVEAAVLDQEPVIRTDLCPGDSLYLPKGWLHAAEAREEMTIHLTVGIPVTTRWRIVRALITKCVDDVELREPLPLGVDLSDPAVIEPIVAETAKVLGARVTAVEPEAVAEQLRSWVWPTSRPAPIAPLAQARLLETLGTDTPVRPRPGLRWVVHVKPDALVLELPGRRISLPAGSTDAVRTALAGTSTPSSLPGLSDEGRLALVRQLLREGVLVPGS